MEYNYVYLNVYATRLTNRMFGALLHYVSNTNTNLPLNVQLVIMFPKLSKKLMPNVPGL